MTPCIERKITLSGAAREFPCELLHLNNGFVVPQYVNGRQAKPAREVKPGDVPTLRFTSRTMAVEVLGTPVSGRKPNADELYQVTSGKLLPRNGEL